ncbi:MAG TPA: hypothetical protein VHZ97_06760 [Pseudonocardiaceae bacterium]|nr:hypothetical protein [Pseudonocardiaceae bacterium]
MMTGLVVIGVLILSALAWGFLVDRRSRRSGKQLRSAGQMQAAIRNARNDQRARNRMRRLYLPPRR